MKRFVRFALAALALTNPGALPLMSQNASGPPNHWLEQLPATPEFSVAPTKKSWEWQRRRVRKQLDELLGPVPARPKRPNVRTLSRDDKGHYFLEKFQFDNGAGAQVPGYLLVPKNAAGRVPAILYCHWHGGQYEIGKEELFLTNA